MQLPAGGRLHDRFPLRSAIVTDSTGHRHQRHRSRINGKAQEQGESPTFASVGMDPESKARMLQHLEEAERHVERGKQHLRKQCELIDQLKRDGHDSSSATALLHTLEQSQMMHIADRDRIRERLAH